MHLAVRRLAFVLLAASASAAGALGSDFDGLTVERIEFVPEAQPLSIDRRASVLDVREGSPLRAEDLRTSIVRLYETGRYEAIEVEADRENGGVAIRFHTSPAWFVGDVDVTGADEPPTRNQLITATKLRLGRRHTEEAVADGLRGLRRILADNGYPEPVVEVVTLPRPDAYQVDITFKVLPLTRAGVGQVVVSGDSGLSPDQAREIAKWGPGRPYTFRVLQAGLDRLRNHLHDQDHWLATVRLTGTNYNSDENRIDPVVRIEKGPKLNLRVEGVELSPKAVRRSVPIFDEGVIAVDLLEEGAENLRERLESDGHFEALVEYEIERETPELISIVYRVDRGPKQRLERVEIAGNLFFDEETIRARMLVEESSLQARRGRFSHGLLERDLEAIFALYEANGFEGAQIESSVERGGKRGLTARITIDEGRPTIVEELIVRGLERFPLDGSQFQLASAEGQPFSRLSVATDRDLILAEYFNAGFQGARFDWATRPGSAADRIVVEYSVEEGEQLFVRQPLISGLEHTDPVVVEQQVVLRPGEPLSQTSMFETQRRLYDLGVFSKVEVSLQNPDGDEPDKNVLVDLEEARRWAFGFGGGAEFARIGGGTVDPASPVGDASFSPRLTLELTRLNFRGKGHTLGFRSRVSNLQQRALATFENPRWNGSENWKMTLSALLDTSRNVRTFTGTRAEGAFQLEQRLSRALTSLYRYTFRRTTIDEKTLQITPELIPLSARPVRAALVSGTLIQDRRDDPTDSTRGIFNTVDVSLASGIWGSQPDFFRFLGQNSSYHRVTRKVVVARTIQLGLMAPWSDRQELDPMGSSFGSTPDPRIPISERFFAGGANSHRGFPVNQAGPRDPTTGFPIGGGAQFLNSVEVRFPLVGRNLGGVLFHDAGNVYSELGDITLRSEQLRKTKADGTQQFEFDYMVHAVGLGVRYRTPIGPVRFDLAYSVNPPRFIGRGSLQEQGISHVQFHFSLGQTF